MKVLAVLLCVFVAVQGRSAGVQSSGVKAAAGENPWVVHLRLAVGTSGLLNSCVGSIISPNWLLTSKTCVDDARFIWVRYGALNVINPELVLEAGTAAVRPHPDADVALISIARNVELSDNINSVSLVGGETPESTSFCSYGEISSGVPGEVLSCFDVTLQSEDGLIVATSDDGGASEFDTGAPLVSNGVQVGILTASADDSSAGKFLPVADYLDWIASETGLDFSSTAAKEADSEDLRVKFVD